MKLSEKSIIKGTAIPVRGNDIDTDRIIPARFMKVVTFDGLGDYAFYDARFDEKGNPADHPFNNPVYSNAEILIVNKNFGCGSSREHAPQSLARWGIKGIIGESFAEIFAGNCTAMGIPAVTTDEKSAAELMDMVTNNPELALTINIEIPEIRIGNKTFPCTIPPSKQAALLKGTWDSTEILLKNRKQILKTAAGLPYIGGFSS